jgi:phosphoenolpyruvate carboxykinase (GTP)
VVWAEGRVHKDFNAIKTPIGYIPTYQDLKNLFRKLLNKTYLPQDYEVQFSIRIDKYLEKIQRMEKAYEDEDLPSEFWKIHYELKTELTRLKLELGNSILSPTLFE